MQFSIAFINWLSTQRSHESFKHYFMTFVMIFAANMPLQHI